MKRIHYIDGTYIPLAHICVGRIMKYHKITLSLIKLFKETCRVY